MAGFAARSATSSGAAHSTASELRSAASALNPSARASPLPSVDGAEAEAVLLEAHARGRPAQRADGGRDGERVEERRAPPSCEAPPKYERAREARAREARGSAGASSGGARARGRCARGVAVRREDGRAGAGSCRPRRQRCIMSPQLLRRLHCTLARAAQRPRIAPPFSSTTPRARMRARVCGAAATPRTSLAPALAEKEQPREFEQSERDGRDAIAMNAVGSASGETARRPRTAHAGRAPSTSRR